MSTDRWSIELDSPGRRYYSAAVVLSGLAIEDFVHTLLLDLAQSIHDGIGPRAARWTDFLLAVSNRMAAGDAEDEVLDNAVADAWDALAPELPSHIRLPLPEARYVAHQINKVCGRASIEERAV